MKRALVTGGSGFVGAAFTRRLHAEGYKVLIVDDMSSEGSGERFARLQRVTRLRADIRDFIKSVECEHDLIIHCAAVVGGRLKIDGDPLAVATDLAIDSDFFKWVVKANNRPKIVYFSSSAVYPIELQTQHQYTHLAESIVHFDGYRVGIPDRTYGWSKLTGEYLAQRAVKQYGADVVIYRPFSGYGEDQSFDYPFPSIVRRVVNRENPITIWGSGDQARDFIHIDDIVEAVMQTKDVLEPGEVLNLGSGEAVSFNNLVRRVFGVCAGLYPVLGEYSVQADTTKPEGVFYRVADTYKLDRFYRPRISLEEGIERVAAHLTKAKEAV